MNPADRKKILIAAGVVVLALIVLVFVLKGRKPGPGAGRGAGGFGPAGAQATETAVARGPAGRGAAAPAQAAGGAAPPAPGAAPAAGGAIFGVIQLGSGSAVKTRPDPFLTFVPPPQPPPPELAIGMPLVMLQTGGLRPTGVEEMVVAGIARRRVSGLLFDEGAYAILEGDQGQAFVVKPGDVVQGNRVIAISRDSIFVEDQEGKRWQVRLRGAGPASGAEATTSSVIGGMPESPPAEP